MHQPALLALLPLLPFLTITTAQCPSPTTTIAVAWPDDLYRSREILVSTIGATNEITTYVGVDCPNNPRSMTMEIGPGTFSWIRSGGSGPPIIDDCEGDGDGMLCVATWGPGTTTTITHTADEVYTVSMAVVESGAENTVLPTITGPPYVGCPNAWQRCGEDPWCCPETATICTIARNGHEACASVVNEALPGPAIPYYTPMGPPPGEEEEDEDSSEPSGSEDGAGAFAAQPTHLLVGGLAGLGLALL
ncbi:hypothetical protein BJX65DRAFT_311406 [Aspergillus insuetus]